MTLIDFVVGRGEAEAHSSELQVTQAKALSYRLSAELARAEIGTMEVLDLPWVYESGSDSDSLEELRRLLKLNKIISKIVLSNGDATSLVVSRLDADGRALNPVALAQWAHASNGPITYGSVVHQDGGKLAQFVVRSRERPNVTAFVEADLRFVGVDAGALSYGTSGSIYVVDSDGKIVAHKDARYSLRETDVRSEWSLRGWNLSDLTSQTQPFVMGRSLLGDKVMASALRMERQGWWLVVEQSESEALAPVRRQLQRNLWLLVLGVACASALAYIFARGWSDPIVQLSMSAKRIAKGSFPQDVVVGRQDELGDLAKSFNEMASELQFLTNNLEQKIAEKTNQLETEFTKRESQSKEIVKLEERARIMRDFHDGVGGHLVSLLGAAKRDALDAKQIEQMVNDALVDFRIAIDSLSPDETDMTTALASLRFRLLPRLKAAGLASNWAIDALPDKLGFSREAIFHVQRIMAEAITNVVKHASASRVDVRVRLEAGADASKALTIEVADDGVGISSTLGDLTEPRRGRGVSNIRQRAGLIGGEVAWVPTSEGGQGTTLRLTVPTKVEAEVVA
jgi:signal transduction histidine kinase